MLDQLQNQLVKNGFSIGNIRLSNVSSKAGNSIEIYIDKILLQRLLLTLKTMSEKLYGINISGDDLGNTSDKSENVIYSLYNQILMLIMAIYEADPANGGKLIPIQNLQKIFDSNRNFIFELARKSYSLNPKKEMEIIKYLNTYESMREWLNCLNIIFSKTIDKDKLSNSLSKIARHGFLDFGKECLLKSDNIAAMANSKSVNATFKDASESEESEDEFKKFSNSIAAWFKTNYFFDKTTCVKLEHGKQNITQTPNPVEKAESSLSYLNYALLFAIVVVVLGLGYIYCGSKNLPETNN